MIVRRASTVDRLILLEVEGAGEATARDQGALEDHTQETTLQETEEGLDLDLRKEGRTMTIVTIILTPSLRFTFQTWTAEQESKISEMLSESSDLSSL